MDPAPGFRCQANGLAEAPREMALAEIAALRDHGYRRIGTQTCKSKGDARIDPADGQQAGLQSSLQEREAARRRRQLCQALPQALDGCPAPDTSAERRVGQECVRTCSLRWSRDH